VIPPAFLQDLLSRTDIVEVVGRHVQLKKGGANLMGLCPFHAEKSPSFSVSPSKQFYYCFGCGASGDAIRFLTEHTGMSFIDAVRDLAQQAGMSVPEAEVSPEDQVKRKVLRERRLTLIDVLSRAAQHFRAQLKASPVAIDYLKRRGLTGEVAARFGLGYAPPGWHSLASAFPDYDDPLLEESGLVRAPTDEDDGPEAERRRYDWFRNRVMFPIRSVQGEIIGFGGRVLDDSKPKYMNSPETTVFSKGRELYGLFEARQALRDKGYVLVVEGYMDVVALAQSGFANAVATLGTACTADHVQKLFRFTDSVVFSFDGDAAGRRAAARALQAALPYASDLRTVRFLFLPPEHDPDSFVRERGPAAFEEAVAKAVPLSRQLLELAAEGADLGTAEGRARMLANARPWWTDLPDGALKRQLLPELAQQARLAIDDLSSLWGQQAAAPQRALAVAPRGLSHPPPRSHGRRAPAASADLALRLLMRHSDWWERLSSEDHQLLHDLGGPPGRAVQWLEQQLTEHGPLTWAALQPALSGQDWEADARRWMDAAAPDEEQSFADLMRVMHRLWYARKVAEVNALAAEGRTDREHLDRIGALNEEIKNHRAAEAALNSEAQMAETAPRGYN